MYSSLTAHLQACDKGEGMNCSTAEVTVYVLDFNDEFPLFDFSTYRTDLCHTHSPNEVFMQPVAIDMDSGSNAQLTYSLEVRVQVLHGQFIMLLVSLSLSNLTQI